MIQDEGGQGHDCSGRAGDEIYTEPSGFEKWEDRPHE